MRIEPKLEKWMKCGENFYWNLDMLQAYALENLPFFSELFAIKQRITPNLRKLQTQHKDAELINTLFSEIYTLATMRNYEYAFFLKGSPIYKNVYESCLYSGLCLFLYYSKRRKRKSLSQFTYDNSLNLFNKEDSQYYCPPDNYSDILNTKASSLRQTRHRLLSSRPVYDTFPQWSIMTNDLEYEWNLYHILSETPPPPAADIWRSEHNITIEDFDIIRDTLKRIGNLYNDIYKVLKSEKTDNYQEMVQKAYEKFNSKLGKLKYANYIKLQKVLITYIYENPKHLGTLFYRYEKENRTYIMMNEVNALNNCEDARAHEIILEKSILLKDIYFPQLYDTLFNLPPYSQYILDYIKYLPNLNLLVNFSLCLILEDLLACGFWNNEEWESIFFDVLNEMIEKVFYNPRRIDFSTQPKSQANFMALLTAPIQSLLERE